MVVSNNEDVIKDILRLHKELGSQPGAITDKMTTTVENQAFPRVGTQRVGGSS